MSTNVFGGDSIFSKLLEVLWAARYDYRPGWELKIHRHDYYQIIYCFSGTGDHTCDGESYPIKPSALLLIKPGAMHGLTVSGTDTVKTLDIKFHVHDDSIRQELDSMKSNVICLSEVKDLMESIRREGLEKDLHFKEFCSLHLGYILFTVLRKQGNKPQSFTNEFMASGSSAWQGICRKVIDIIQKDYAKDLTLLQICTTLGYHPAYICQCFKKAYNSTAMQYLSWYRIKEAKSLLAYSDDNIKQIAFMVGFKDIHHFSRLFRKLEGTTPGKWREEVKEGICKDVYISDEFINQSYTRMA